MGLDPELIELLTLNNCTVEVFDFGTTHTQLFVHYKNVLNFNDISLAVKSFYPNAILFKAPWVHGNTVSVVFMLEKQYQKSTLVPGTDRNLIFITGHQQVNELEYYSKFLNRTETMKNFDLILHINKTDIDIETVRKWFLTFPNKNKHLIFTSKNYGYKLGPHEALSDFYGIISTYDNVMHTHPDVFIIDENKLLEIMYSNRECGIVVGCSNINPTVQEEQNPQFATDCFMIRPKIIGKNIFKDYELPEYANTICEEFLEDVTKKNNIPYAFVKKYDNDWYAPRRLSLWGIWHEHELYRLPA
jgi:hypothetical protein